MDLELAGKRAIVTGASRGIGKAVSASLAAEGVGVVLAARTLADLERAAVVEQGRLVGVLSRSVVQRRLAEDEPRDEPDHS